jgi:hypothetical protein
MSTVELYTAIINHPARQREAQTLFLRLNEESPGHVYCCPPELPSVWAAAKWCWKSIPAEATHLLVLQEDILPCRDFIAGMKAAVAIKPDSIISPYCSHNEARIARVGQAGGSWLPLTGSTWGQGILMPRALIRQFLEFEYAVFDDSFPHDDTRVSIFSAVTGNPNWVIIPNLIQHTHPKASILKYNNAGKVSSTFIGAEESALQVDFTRGTDQKPFWTGIMKCGLPYLKKAQEMKKWTTSRH